MTDQPTNPPTQPHILQGITLTPTVATAGPESTVIAFLLTNPAAGENTTIHISQGEDPDNPGRWAYSYSLNEGDPHGSFDSPYDALSAAFALAL